MVALVCTKVIAFLDLKTIQRGQDMSKSINRNKKKLVGIVDTY
jgi:hypothetical protein